MSAVLAGEDELPDKVVLMGTQGPAFSNAIWFGVWAVLYMFIGWSLYIIFAFGMGMSNRPPTISKSSHVILMVCAMPFVIALTVLAEIQAENPVVVATVLVLFAVAILGPFAIAPTGGRRLEVSSTGANLVDWWRARSFLWSDYDVEVSLMPDGKVGDVGFSRALEVQAKDGQHVQSSERRETVFLPDHFGLKKEDLARLLQERRARSLGIPLDPVPYKSPSWKV